MKKIMNLVLSLFLAGTLCGCGTAGFEDQINDPAWDTLLEQGKVETENGQSYVKITVPSAFAGELTQEEIDSKAGETYTSGTLNNDGSITYKMTKKQHKAMLDTVSKSIEEGLKSLTDSPDYAIADIKHNNDFTSFDVTLDTEELGLTESFMVLGFYMFGGMYAVFSGVEAKNIAVNYYSASGKLIHTANSSETEE